jgi:hypothetical protein
MELAASGSEVRFLTTGQKCLFYMVVRWIKIRLLNRPHRRLTAANRHSTCRKWHKIPAGFRAGSPVVSYTATVMPRAAATSAADHRRRARERTARWRKRVHRGHMVLPLEVNTDLLDILVRMGALRDHQLDDRRVVATAVSTLLIRALGALMRQERKSL